MSTEPTPVLAPPGAKPPIAIPPPSSWSEAHSQLTDVLVGCFTPIDPLPHGPAKAAAAERVLQFGRRLVERLFQVGLNPTQLCDDAGFLYSVAQAEAQIAKSIDTPHQALLTELLVDRATRSSHSMPQIIIDDALRTAPRLTDAQVAALALVLVLRYTQQDDIADHRLLGEYFDLYVQPLADRFPPSPADLEHLQYTGCATLTAKPIALETILAGVHAGLFVRGLTKHEIVIRQMRIEPSDGRFFIPCHVDPTRLQLRARNQLQLERMCAEHRVSSRDCAKLTELLSLGTSTPDEVRRHCIGLRPYMAGIFESWNSTEIRGVALTSVGIAIARAKLHSTAGKFADLRVWVQD